MKKAETFAKPWGKFCVPILPTHFLSLPWALPSCATYPLKKLPLENRSETAAPSLCKTEACLVLRHRLGTLGFCFFACHWLHAKTNLCADPTSPAHWQRQGCCLCLPHACGASLSWSAEDLIPVPALTAACWCTSNSTSIRDQQHMLGNAQQHTQFSLSLWGSGPHRLYTRAAGWWELSAPSGCLPPP